jgi:hypothetical protein
MATKSARKKASKKSKPRTKASKIDAKRKKARPPARKAAKKVKAKTAPRRKVKAKAAPVRKAAKKAKAAPVRKAAKKAKAAPVRKAAKPVAARAKPVMRRDNSGHLNPKYAAELRAQSSPHEVDPKSFIEGSHSKDDLVEELGEEFVEQATSAEYKAEDALNADVTEEVGGPFVETGGGTEFAEGTDPSNPASATREPFPRS